ncbi:MAG: hypothetical protein OXU77_02410 [Gammaproteobacteria bacterium]|nr:hypothetical protein [Gammaproteobacteria bacterium]MDE0443560.1 hypothetical protein [Gammaproteobacteria bacterium]
MGEPGGEEDPRSTAELEREKLQADIEVARNEVAMSWSRLYLETSKLRVEWVKTFLTAVGVVGGVLLVLKQIGLVALGD